MEKRAITTYTIKYFRGLVALWIVESQTLFGV